MFYRGTTYSVDVQIHATDGNGNSTLANETWLVGADSLKGAIDVALENGAVEVTEVQKRSSLYRALVTRRG